MDIYYFQPYTVCPYCGVQKLFYSSCKFGIFVNLRLLSIQNISKTHESHGMDSDKKIHTCKTRILNKSNNNPNL